MSLLCGTVAECAAVAEYAMTPYRRYYADGDIKHRYRCACLRNVTDAAMQRVMPGNATAIAHAYYDACDNADHRPPAERMHYVEGQHWCGGDYVGYFNRTWLPAVHSLGQACRTMHRIGAPLNIKDGSGDGGKTLCEAERLLSPPGCLVVSVGISSDTRFESNLHQFQPNCRVIGYDGTLTPAMTAAVPSFVELRPTNFAIDSWKNFTRRAHVNLLKIDCEGCEYSALVPWVEHVCTDQITVEVHKTRGAKGRGNRQAQWIHRLMSRLHHHGYQVAHAEFNLAWPPNVEYTLVRSTPCSRRHVHD